MREVQPKWKRALSPNETEQVGVSTRACSVNNEKLRGWKSCQLKPCLFVIFELRKDRVTSFKSIKSVCLLMVKVEATKFLRAFYCKRCRNSELKGDHCMGCLDSRKWAKVRK